jgi:hypothetical protein
VKVHPLFPYNSQLNLYVSLVYEYMTILYLFGMWVIYTVIIGFAIHLIKYGNTFLEEAKAYPKTAFSSNKMLNITVFIILLGLIYGGVGAVHLMTGLEMTGKKWVELLVPVGIIGTVAIGLTMVLINTLPLIMRTFENTIGYAIIRQFGETLNTIIKDGIIDKETSHNIVDYTVLATQLYVENFKAYLGSMVKGLPESASISRFTNVFVDSSIFDKDRNLIFTNQDQPTKVAELLQKIIAKRAWSETTWISLGTLFTILGTYYYTA